MNVKPHNWMIRALLIASVASLSACVPGDFCDVVRGPLEFAPETSAQIVATDRDKAEQIAAQNDYWNNRC